MLVLFPNNTSHWDGSAHLGDLWSLSCSGLVNGGKPPSLDKEHPPPPPSTHGIIDKDSHSG